jgi:hypothetical protein
LLSAIRNMKFFDAVRPGTTHSFTR